ncbi:hypothetical protein AB0D57_20620 [Streptomyces sp. NPDC048275]|uniref:hypothetical protein n=1 Tax=Streptomyces sp. NPDC048275 TaxID=3155629 RepID=UPI0033DCAAE7
MAVEQLPVQVGEFARYLSGLMKRLGQDGGWCAVFWQRDPDGMRAWLEGWEVPPWDVVEALLQDLAAEYGAQAAAQEVQRARSLHGASLAAYDARPGGRDALGDRLDVTLREQRYAAERVAELGRQLHSAGPQREAESLRIDLAWAHDDHERAVARCAELRLRTENLDRSALRTHASGALEISGRAGGDVLRVGGAEEAGGLARGARQGPEERAAEAGPGSPEAAARRHPIVPEQTGPRSRFAALDHSVTSGAGSYDPALHRPDAYDSYEQPGTGPRPGSYAPARPGQGSDPYAVPAERPERPDGPQPATAPTARPDPAPGPAPKQRSKRRARGSARFAGMMEEEAETAPVAVPETAAPPLPAPAATSGRKQPRGARFAGAAEEPAQPRTQPLDEDARRATTETVQTLIRLRREGRSGEAHAVLVEAAYWPAPRFPLLAAELHRAGLDADWATLLWEAAASLPADRLVGAADALVAAGRVDDGRQMLRQGVARPAPEIGTAVLGLADEGRRRDLQALLDAYVRVRTPEEAARSVEADPGRLVPLLLAAARGVSEQCHWDLVHALRVAGFTA